MKGLDSLLDKFKRSLGRDTGEREAVAGAIREAAGFDIRLEDVSIKGEGIYIKTTPAKRSEIKLHEDRILSLVRERTGLNLKKISY